MDYSRAYSVDNGFIIDEENGGPFCTGGTASPIGLDLPQSTLYIRTTSEGVELWRKYGPLVTEWRKVEVDRNFSLNCIDEDFDIPSGQEMITSSIELKATGCVLVSNQSSGIIRS